jgi:MATH domain.
MEYKLTGWSNRRSLRSPSFYISPGGYRMYIRIYPRQNEDNFYVHVGVTLGDYDDKLPWPFKLKHRVNILDQMSSEVGAQEDISSRVWDPTLLCSEFNWQKPTTGDNYECVGLGFPHSVIRSRNYIRDDTIIIKLTVYLD